MWIPLIGESTDCETCGPSFDELTVEFDGEDAQRPWMVTLRVGCTGGGTFAGNRTDVIDWMRANCSHVVDSNDLETAIRTLERA